ncbi:MAG: D-tyrosyl-tRNA(Tyr) deacylase [Prevotellaceae bacterium]|jgi:D-tyrosyl-tRNA(Tyr) deacylase|nr:D-tyrosyl-tRNA(Tyr) deacylase [Prevotellaceae bacterium]
MRVLIQRVKEASVAVGGKTIGQIRLGLLLFVSFEESDTSVDLDAAAAKVSKLRIFDDDKGVMNLSISDIKGEFLVISQFTLHAQTKKGNRPSYIRAANPAIAKPLYEQFIARLQQYSEFEIQTGEFGADMQVSLINDGPVTIWIDTALELRTKN